MTQHCVLSHEDTSSHRQPIHAHVSKIWTLSSAATRGPLAEASGAQAGIQWGLVTRAPSEHRV